jgi:hypothetical protein
MYKDVLTHSCVAKRRYGCLCDHMKRQHEFAFFACL